MTEKCIKFWRGCVRNYLGTAHLFNSVIRCKQRFVAPSSRDCSSVPVLIILYDDFYFSYLAVFFFSLFCEFFRSRGHISFILISLLPSTVFVETKNCFRTHEKYSFIIILNELFPHRSRFCKELDKGMDCKMPGWTREDICL